MDQNNVCQYCHQRFYSSFNLHRHQLRFHRALMEFAQEDQEINDMESETGSQDSNNINEDETNDAPESEDETNDEPKSEEFDTDDEYDYWQILINETFKEMGLHKEIKNPKEILLDPILTEFLEELRENLEGRMKFAEYMQNQDKVYQEIQNTAERHSRKDLDEDEAFEKAWNERKYLLKRLIRDNLNVIKSAMEESASEESEDEQNAGKEDEDTHELI